MNLYCCTNTRRNEVLLHPTLNGIDYLEVSDELTDPDNEPQTTLFVHFLKPIAPIQIKIANLRIEGGERIRNIEVIQAEPERDNLFRVSTREKDGKVLVVKVAKAGDFSTYTLHLVNLPDQVFDPALSAVDFSFKVGCASEFDCKPAFSGLKEPVEFPEINYLAKDYASFRQLMLDRMAFLLPAWKERNPADLGITLVELLAYVADYLSYRQDAIASEAYLGTSRKRISVKRHARLVDYFMHEGCNARAWLQIKVKGGVNGTVIHKGKGIDTTKILTGVHGLASSLMLNAPEYKKALNVGARVFEMMHDIPLYFAHNEMHFYAGGGSNCWLLKGATEANLSGDFPSLKKGDVLIFIEVLGPKTGVPQDADPSHRHAVRLVEDADNATTGFTGIKWGKSDALPFSLCISNRNGFKNVSIALGNIVLVDHGLTIKDQHESSLQPATVPSSNLFYAQEESEVCNNGEPTPASSIPSRFRPRLIHKPLTYASSEGPDNSSASASTLIKQSVRATMPAITLQEDAWTPARDLLNSAFNAQQFVVEMESDGAAYLRFGDNKQGLRPSGDTKFMAQYRIGNGTAGNVGAGALTHIATDLKDIIASVWNPLPAQGGMEAESMEEVKQFAPAAFQRQERAVTLADYEEFAKRCSSDVQRAAATLRWTGSWETVFLSADRLGGQQVDDGFEKKLRSCLEQYRMAGFDLEVDAPLYVSLEIEMVVCVNPHFFAADVKKALLELFSNRNLANGRRGLFHPDNYSFGQPVFLSPLYAGAQATQGVDSVQITKFRRQGDTGNGALFNGKLSLSRREIARLNNDPNYPELGVFNLVMKGGR